MATSSRRPPQPGTVAGAPSTPPLPGTVAGAPSTPPACYTARFKPLLLLREIMVGYLFLGVRVLLTLPNDFIPLQAVSDFRSYFLQEGYIATLLYHLIPLFLLMTHRQSARKKRACGGWNFANRFTPADLKQEPANDQALRRMGSAALCDLLKRELRLFLRLLRAAQLACWRALEGTEGRTPPGPDWRDIHDAACVVLLRLAQISAAFTAKGQHLLAETCLRWEARAVWGELFGQAPQTEEELEWLGPPRAARPCDEERVMYHLLRERKLGRPVAAPLQALYRAWYREPPV